jgi:hypothetical protein
MGWLKAKADDIIKDIDLKHWRLAETKEPITWQLARRKLLSENYHNEIEYLDENSGFVHGEPIFKGVQFFNEHGKRNGVALTSESFEQILREEFLVNTQNYPKEYHQLFHEIFNRAEKQYKEQPIKSNEDAVRYEGYIQEKDNAIGELKKLIQKGFLRAYGLGYEAAAIGENPYPTECWRTFKTENKL